MRLLRRAAEIHLRERNAPGDAVPILERATALTPPDPREVGAGIAVPEVPAELPAVMHLLRQMLPDALDPWALDLSTDAKP